MVAETTPGPKYRHKSGPGKHLKMAKGRKKPEWRKGAQHPNSTTDPKVNTGEADAPPYTTTTERPSKDNQPGYASPAARTITPMLNYDDTDYEWGEELLQPRSIKNQTVEATL